MHEMKIEEDRDEVSMAYGAFIRLREIERHYTVGVDASIVFGAFALYLAHLHPGVTDLEALLNTEKISENLKRCIKDRIGTHWDVYLLGVYDFRPDELRAFLVGRRFYEEYGRRSACTTPTPLVELAKAVLGVQARVSVCDLGSGVGDFLMSAARGKAGNSGELAGVDFCAESVAMAETRCFALGLKVKFVLGDVFDEQVAVKQYDRVFSNPPLSMRTVAHSQGLDALLHGAFPDFPRISPTACNDWLFVARAAMSLKDGGRGAIVLGLGSLFRSNEAPYRNFLIQRGFIEAIVELPANLLENTAVPVCLVILSKGNESVRMIDASGLYQRTRGRNILATGAVERIQEMLEASATEGSDFQTISREELQRNDSNLNVRQYVNREVVSFEGVRLGDLIVRSYRGAALHSEDVEDLMAGDEEEEGHSAVRFVTPADIEDGLINANVRRLKRCPKEQERLCAQTGDLLLCRIMTNISGKIAVVENKGDERVLPNSNMLVLSIDRQKADSYFLRTFLESKFARGCLKDSGSVLQMLQVSKLEAILVPKIPLVKQREIGARCKAMLDEIEKARRTIRESRENLGRMFEESCQEFIKA